MFGLVSSYHLLFKFFTKPIVLVEFYAHIFASFSKVVTAHTKAAASNTIIIISTTTTTNTTAQQKNRNTLLDIHLSYLITSAKILIGINVTF